MKRDVSHDTSLFHLGSPALTAENIISISVFVFHQMFHRAFKLRVTT